MLLGIVFPPLAVRSAGQPSSASALGVLRQVLVSFGVALVLIGVVVAVLSAGDQPVDGPSSGIVAGVIIGYGVLSVVLPRMIEPPLDCSSDAALAGAYRTRFFLRVAFADATALLGFVGFFLTGEAWLYPLGAAFTVVGFLRLAPTESNLETEQAELHLAGCARSLRAALTTGNDAP